MESKYHAMAFLVVLAIVCLGAYMAINAILSAGRTPLISLATSTPTRLTFDSDQTTVAPGSPIPTNTPFAPPTPVVPTATPVLPTSTSMPTPPTPVPIAATPIPTEPSSEPTSTPAPPTPGEYQYAPDGPVRSECGKPSALIYGWVRDAHDEKLAGVRVRVSDQWGNVAEAISKGENETGYYDVVRGMEIVTWKVVVVDGTGNPLSPVVNIEPVQGTASCWYQLDWQRTY